MTKARLLAALLLAAGCAPRGDGYPAVLPRDTGPTTVSAGVLTPYTAPEASEAARRTSAAPRPATAVPNAAELPGEPDRPWAGPPRTLPYAPGPEPAAIRPALPGAAPGRPGADALRPGERIRVTVERHPEFSGEWGLDAEGRAAIPDGGAFGVGTFTGRAFAAGLGPLSGLEPTEAARRIGARLRPFFRSQPRVTVVPAGRGEL
jgi:hypothetical protein